MSEEKAPPTEKMLENLARLVKEADGTPEAGLQALAQIQRRRAGRLAQVQQRLAANLEAGDPRLVKVEQAFSRARQLEKASLAEAKRLKEQLRSSPDTWVVAGRFNDAGGRPISEASVRLLTQEGRVVEFVGTVKTNERGEFAIELDKKRLEKQFGQEVPDFVVELREAERGTVLFTSEAVKGQYGHVDLFEASIARPVVADPGPGRPVKPKATATGTVVTKPVTPDPAIVETRPSAPTPGDEDTRPSRPIRPR